MKKIIVLFFFIILFSGCSADYNIEISKDFKFKETLNINLANNSFEIAYDSFSHGVEATYNNINKYLDVPLYSYTLNRGIKYSDVEFSNKYDNEISLLESSFFRNTNAKIETYKNENGNQVFQILIDYDFHDWLNANKYTTININKMNLNIIFPYEIISSNADKMDDNKLTWNLQTLKKQRSFYIEYNINKSINSNNNFVVLLIIVLFVVFISAFIIIKKRKTNSI